LYGKARISYPFVPDAALPFLAAGAMKAQAQPVKKSLKIMMKSAWGRTIPTNAAFQFSHGLALSEAGHDVQIFLLSEAVSLMRKAVANSVTPVGWPPIVESLTNFRFFSRVGGPHHHGIDRASILRGTAVSTR
jgi:hypothetical protein